MAMANCNNLLCLLIVVLIVAPASSRPHRIPAKDTIPGTPRDKPINIFKDFPFPWGKPEDFKPKKGLKNAAQLKGGLKKGERILEWPSIVKGLPMPDTFAFWMEDRECEVENSEGEQIKVSTKQKYEKLDQGVVRLQAEAMEQLGVRYFGGKPLKPVQVYELNGNPHLSWKEERKLRPLQFVGVVEDEDGSVRWFAKRRPKRYPRKRPFYLRVMIPDRAGMIQYLVANRKAEVVVKEAKDGTSEPTYRLAPRRHRLINAPHETLHQLNRLWLYLRENGMAPHPHHTLTPRKRYISFAGREDPLEDSWDHTIDYPGAKSEPLEWGMEYPRLFFPDDPNDFDPEIHEWEKRPLEQQPQA